jgi:hypothetical protein
MCLESLGGCLSGRESSFRCVMTVVGVLQEMKWGLRTVAACLSLESTYADAMQVVNSYMPSELKTIMLSDKFAVLPWIPW